MLIEKKAKLKNNYYYVVIDVEYKIDKHGLTLLYFKDGKNYDGGDFSRLIERCEKSYSYKKASAYDGDIGFMGDVLYLYDRIPFLIGIQDVYISENSVLPYSTGFIPKEEIDKYIKDHKIKMNKNPNFKLYDEDTWIV